MLRLTHSLECRSGSGAAGLPEAKATFVQLSVKRPRDGEEIFACGFPFGEPGLVTTSGAIASAWKTDLLIAAKAAGVVETVETYWADLRINPGNSGGPLLNKRGQAIGVVSFKLRSSENLNFAVPINYVRGLLTTLHEPMPL